jgi:hypothetical protein
MPVLKGAIARRILVNFRADPDVIQAQLPQPFRPKLHNGYAMVGVCLIRLEHIRPAALPLPIGVASENAAHRMAVLWDEDSQTREGVFIPRRDTASLLNYWLGGRVFPGQHHLATFQVQATNQDIRFRMRSPDDALEVRVVGQIQTDLPQSSCFASLADASKFFEGGSLGYSIRRHSHRLDGLILKTQRWRVEALTVSEVFSSYYADETKFPKGSVVFDHALIMRNIEHEWHATDEM